MQPKICIIDDDLVSQFATRYCIEQYDKGFLVSTYSNAEEGLEMMASLSEQNKVFPDIIFLDLIMGDMNGWDFLKELQVVCKGKKMPTVYILSAFSNARDRAIAKENPLIAGYMDKPLSINSLNKIFTSNKKSK